jgi:NAD(P)-dependent dehydrogenase (short-subunit alcohol dehydrogenase family)
MPTALIIGASRGIGLELARQYRAAGWRTIATVRKPSDAATLEQMGAEIHLLDVTDHAQCVALGNMLAQQTLDIAILNAGINCPPNDPTNPPSQAEFDTLMHTNVLAAMWLLPRIAPAVCAAQGKLAVISSRMGSLTTRNNAYGSLYRASKAALNSVLVDIAHHMGPLGAHCATLHPGWVRTDMGGTGADISVEESAQGIRNTLAALRQNGVFLNYDGSPMAW